MKSIFSLFILLMSVNILAEAPRITSSLSYQELQKLKSSASVSGLSIGYSVAIDGDTAVVGAYGNVNTWNAYIYQYDEASKIFLQKAVLTSTNLISSDYFGRSVAISGDTVVVGAYQDSEINTNSGAAYIYEKPIDGWADTTEEDAKLKAFDADVNDYFGRSVAISGNTVVIGANGDDETNTNSGSAYIYEKPSTEAGWIDTAQQDAKLKAFDSDIDDYFGISVAISGDTIIIGAYGEDDISNASGAAYIYEKPLSGVWATTSQEEARLKASDADVADYFGYSVAISGDTVIVGAYLDDETSTDAGAGYIYEKPNTVAGWADTNQQNVKLKASDADVADYFGYSVAISGDTVIVGSYQDDEINSASGSAYVYEKPLSGNWIDTAKEKAKLKASDADGYDRFGISVAISGDTVVIGAKGDDETSIDSGAAYIFANSLTQNTVENKTDIMQIEASDADMDTFTFSLDGGDDVSLFTLSSSGLLGFVTAKDYENPIDADADNIYEVQIKLTDQSNSIRRYKSFIRVSDISYEGKSLEALSLKELQKLKESSLSYHAYFGYSVAIDGNTAVVGAYGVNANRGEAYIYQYDEASKIFLQKAILTSININSGDRFGTSVAISGDTVIIGADEDDGINTNSGAAYIYEKPLIGWVGTITESVKLKVSDANSSDRFGGSVSISGDTAIIGARYDDETSTSSGAAYIYIKPSAGWAFATQEDSKLKASDADSDDNFGVSVAISGNTVIIGAEGDDEISTKSGAAYIYEKPLLGWATTAQENAKLKASDAYQFDYFGHSVAMSGDTVIIGAYNDDEDINSGAAYIYDKPIGGWADTTQENAKLKASDADSYDYFGISVAISGDTVLVGAYKDDEINSRSGAAYLYEKPSSGVWIDTTQQNAKLKAPDADYDDSFGVSVAISGDTVAIGAYHDDETNDDSGAIYIEKAKNSTSNAAIIMYLLQ